MTAPELAPGTLAAALAAREEAARASRALQPITTDETYLDDAGVRFVVRSVSSLARKQAQAAAQPAAANPFLPPEPELTVGALSPTHVAVLNKNPVVAHHLLIVTREFAPQEQLLDEADFDALARCLAEIDGLAFYNGGRAAGASQPHKHLQLVPLPLGGGTWDVPMEALFDTWSARGGVLRLLQLPFRHAFSLVEPALFDAPQRTAERMHELYTLQMAAIGVVPDDAANDTQQALPYNLLMTRRWMLAVPRAQEHFGAISINALGFAGSLFVRDQSQMQALREGGPMNALRAVTVIPAQAGIQ
jgi:ATP adenylyltransferase